jgi:hypothetical protein
MFQSGPGYAGTQRVNRSAVLWVHRSSKVYGVKQFRIKLVQRHEYCLLLR